MKRLPSIGLAIFALALASVNIMAQGSGVAQGKGQTVIPVAANIVVDQACKRAANEHKSVMLIYHASWCGWCKKLDSVLDKPAVKAIVDKYFVVTHLTVLESDAHKAEENPGGMDMLKAQGGEKAGLPFIVMLDGKGKMTINSIMKVDGKEANTGCPYEPQEIEHFMKMVRTAAPKITKEEAKILTENFEALKKAGK